MSLSNVVRRRTDLLAYVPVALTTTAAAVTGAERTHLVSKLALAPTLAGGVLATRRARPTARTATLVAALAGSCVGDWFMNRSERAADPALRRRLMRRGASAFAVQQTGFIGLMLADGVRPRAAQSIGVGAVMAALGILDVASTGEPDPVIVGYGTLLGSMAALALADAGAPRHRSAVALGGGYFLVSDAVIIIGEHLARTATHRAIVRGVVLYTYTAALLLLVHGLRDEPCDCSGGACVPECPTA